MATNKVRFGLSNCHYAVATISDAGAVTYGSWTNLPNAVSLTADLNSSTSDQYADNVLVYSHNSTTGATITVEFSSLTDDFKTAVLGYITGSKGELIQPINNTKKKIAFGFQFEGDAKASIRVYFLCSVADTANDSANTNNDSVTFQNDSITLTAYPVALASGDYALKETLEADDTGYSNFFTTAFALPTKAS